MLLTYGYEIFNFNLSLDEPVLQGSGQRALASLFAGQGRWGMALQYLVLPETVLPTVTAGVAVILIGGSLWVLSTMAFHLDPVVGGLMTAVVATLPTICFDVSFSTIAVGIGLGFVASTIYGICAGSGTWQKLVLALVFGTFALGIYQGFAFAIFAISVTLVARSEQPRLSVAVRHVALLAACAVSNVVVSAAAKRALDAPSDPYVRSMMDLSGLAADPWGRLVSASERNASVLAPGSSLYENLQPWLALLLVMLVTRALWFSLQGGSGMSRVIRPACVLTLVAIPLSAALLVHELPIRSMVYLPACFLGLAAIAVPVKSDAASVAPDLGRASRWIASALVVLAVIANASVANQAFVASDAAFARDRFVALRIDEERGRLFPDAQQAPAVVVVASQQDGRGTIGRPAEQFGLTLLAGESWRTTSFLVGQGVAVEFPNSEQEKVGLAAAENMPVYPEAGWAKDVQGILVINLGSDR